MDLSQVPGFVYRLYRHDGKLRYIGSTNDIRQRMWQHGFRRLDSAIVVIETFPSLRAARDAEKAAIIREAPPENRQCNPAWLRTDTLVTLSEIEALICGLPAEELPGGAHRYRCGERVITVAPPRQPRKWAALSRALLEDWERAARGDRIDAIRAHHSCSTPINVAFSVSSAVD